MSFVYQVVYLFIANSGRFIIPILFLPVAARLLNAHDFETLSVSISFATWTAIIIEYGFNFSSAKQIKYNSHGPRLEGIIRSTFSARLILSFLGLALGAYTAFYVDRLEFLYILLFWMYSLFVGAVFSFVYICLNDNKKLMKIEFAGATIFFVIITLIWLAKIKSFYVIFSALVFYRFIVFALSIYFLKSVVHIKKISFRFRKGLLAVKKTYMYAIFQLSSSIYLYGLSLIASIVINKNIVIFHLLAERIYKLLTFGFAPVSRVAYSLLNNSPAKKYQVITLLCCFAIISGLVGMTGIYFFSQKIIVLFFGQSFVVAHVNLNILSLALPFAFLNGIMSVSGFLSQGRMKYLNLVILSAGLLVIPVCYIMSLKIPVIAASMSYVFAETLITILLLIRFIPFLVKEKNSES
ncbi:oligosaccharide flippase family protein [Enterobacter cloacae]|uniref:oligosaccharide flippase family protein n=2 Tax=Enterobacter cloacae TaxID=550 RepID=UPI0024DF8103|nr:oligosaccharide flippase family protein [Enterobacter cloacae]MDK2708413.1 oligosaccharide flippase family protein [Enterobacter cloacae]